MATPKTIASFTLGCKLNFSETSTIDRLFEDKGYSKVNFEEIADVYVINTCSVTDFADRKNRKLVRKVKRLAPDAIIVVIGCYAQLKPEEIIEIPGVDLVLGSAQKFKIVDYVEALGQSIKSGTTHVSEIEDVNSFEGAFSVGGRTRSFLKVQDGCDYKCTFCTIPQARGKSRSDTVENVIKNVEILAKRGTKEVVITGVNVGDFGNGTEVIEGERSKKTALFIDLIKEMDQIEGIERYRISSIEPNLVTDEIIEFVSHSNKFMPHFHIPLQSGNNKQLKMMKRRYDRNLYAKKVVKIKSIMPHACIGVDVIVGFPGETDDDFLDTYNFIESMDVSYLHVFTYSERTNTPAIEMEEVVPMNKRKKRNDMLRALSDKKKAKFYNSFIGNKRKVLFERHKDPELMTGFTDNYIKIICSRDEKLLNNIQTVLLEVQKSDFVHSKVLPLG